MRVVEEPSLETKLSTTSLEHSVCSLHSLRSNRGNVSLHVHHVQTSLTFCVFSFLTCAFSLEWFLPSINSKFSLNFLHWEGLLRTPFWWLASFWQWIKSHFYLNFNTRTLVNVILLYTFISLFFPIMAMNLGIWGLIKYYFVPWFVYHFWVHIKLYNFQLRWQKILRFVDLVFCCLKL